MSQSILLFDASNGKFSLSLNQLNNINYNYPSLSLNSVPVLSYLSRYDTNNERYYKAIKKLFIGLENNPYNSYTKYLLSRNYIYLNDFKNAEIYLNEIFIESPKIETSTVLYISVLDNNQNIKKLKEIFSQLININNRNVWTYYLSALKNNMQTLDDKRIFNESVIYFNKTF
tara:strand:- start:44 stop:559 length:516 start_codon:yes stop_codon:yes gene_type:complete